MLALILHEQDYEFVLRLFYCLNLKEGWVIDGDSVEEAGVEANNEAVMVEVSPQPLAQCKSVAEANMGQG